MALKQDLRMGRLSTVLGKDVLVLQRFEGVDRMNGLFEYHVACLAATSDVDFDSLLGTNATVTLVGQDGSDRHFNGLVTEARWLGAGENGHRYQLLLRPWFWLATMRRNQRIFHEMTLPTIIQELLSAYGSAGSVVDKLNGSYPALEYTVQYCESDFNFACRMMERHGISYHFEHKDGAHDLVLTDAVESHTLIGDFPVKPYVGHHQEDVEHIWEWNPTRRMQTGAIRLTDYNFKTPTTVMEKDQAGTSAYEHGEIESFDWPGHYLDPGRGAEMVRFNIDREQGQDKRYEALGDISNLVAGKRFNVSGESEDVPGKGEEFLCLVSHHSYTSDNYGSGGTSGDGFAYTGRYVFMPSNSPLMPEKKTPRSDVVGPQTAMVVGEDKEDTSEEIDCDEYGRILVQFGWDLEGDYSMRCRVSQNWSGGGWGGMIIPRIGMEVLVEFLDGDPDKPLVTGCVYNGRNKMAYPLPEHKTKSVFRTDTYKKTGFNEMVFEDEPDKEHITFKAHKDFSKLVLHDAISRVHHNDVENVGANKLFEVGNNFKVDAGASVNLTVGGTGPKAKDLLNGISGLLGKSKSLANDGITKGGGSGGGGFGKWTSSLASKKHGFHSGSGRSGLREPSEEGDDANHQMRLDGTDYGKAGNDLFETPGTMNTVAANFRSDTTGVASVESVGVTKVLNVGGSLMEQVGKEQVTTIGEKVETYIGQKEKHTVGQKQEITIGQEQKTKVGMNYKMDVGNNMTTKVTNAILTQAAMKQTLTAGMKFTISGPGGSIEIGPSGITIKAMTLKVLCPSVDFNPGGGMGTSAAGNAAATLKSVQAFAEDCRNTAGGD